jgi:DNA-binding MarR family transcriptional regulator
MTSITGAPSASQGVIDERRSTPGLLLAMLGQSAMRRLRAALAAHDLTPRQFFVLGLLFDRGALGQSELGSILGTDPSILVTMLNPLEDRGWLRRERDPADRRRHLVTLTADGKRGFERADAAQREAESALLTGLDEDGRAQLRALLTAVQAGLGHETPLCTATTTDPLSPLS